MKPLLASILFLLPAVLTFGAEPVLLENRALRVEIAPDSGHITVQEKSGSQRWQQAPVDASTPTPVYKVVSATRRTAVLERVFTAAGGFKLPLKLTFTLAESAPEFRVEARPEDLKTPLKEIRFLEPFVLDAPQGVLAVADYSDGHLYPLDTQPFPRGSFGGDRLDMPWVGLCDLESGCGYLLLLETSDDARVVMQKIVGKEKRPLVAPAVVWLPEKGLAGHPRSLLYHFAPSGGYVALCKRYRAYAKEHGLILPFTEKLKKNPGLTRLFGAPDIWGNASIAFAREAKAAGVEKMLIHGKPATPADMKAVNDLGYLTSEYDNYTDVMQTENGKITSDRDLIPDHVVQRSNGDRMTAWLTWDKKQYMKRCPTFWAESAKLTADKVLAEWPFLGRFIDVTTAEALYECYDPNHPLTRSQKRECGPVLHKVFRDRKLVMGGEHGIWWCVPWVDYIEGMQSGGYASWPAGWLLHPKNKEEEFKGPDGHVFGKWENYAKWGIGHEWRAPLWELVFHDCIVSTWYWGDASDFLLDAAPEITPKKDAFNILYGTIPLMWANGEGAWVKDRPVFLRTYRNTCKLHESLATEELVSHEFLTADHAVQRTRFSGGTTCLVNFGEKPYRTETGGKSCELPQNGWVVTGPKAQQSLLLENGKPVTTLRSPGYLFTDRGGTPVTMRLEGEGRLRVQIDQSADRVTLRPGDVVSGWRADHALLYRLDGRGELVDQIEFHPATDGAIEFGPVTSPVACLLLSGDAARKPDLRVSRLSVWAIPVRTGDTLCATATIANVGGTAARHVAVEWSIDSVVISHSMENLEAGAKSFSLDINTRLLDGDRCVAVTVDPEHKITELCKQNNRAETMISIAPDWSRWSQRKLLRIESGEVARENESVTVPFTLPVGADPNSVRVALVDGSGQPGQSLPAQLAGDELSFVLPGKLAAGGSARVAVLWREMGSLYLVPPHTHPEKEFNPNPVLPAPGGSFWREAHQSIVTPVYEARFENGTLTFLAIRKVGLTGPNFLKNLIVSSRDTGWGEEAGTVEKFQVKQAGPVRTVLGVTKRLKTGVAYEKTYAFYADRFDLEISVEKPCGGLYSRAHYHLPCTYIDDKGHQAAVDGKGDAEGVAGQNPNPKWYAVWTPTWAHSCVARSVFENVSYWDSGGGFASVGFTVKGSQTSGIRLSYVLHPGATDAGFAAEDHRRLTTPASVHWE